MSSNVHMNKPSLFPRLRTRLLSTANAESNLVLKSDEDKKISIIGMDVEELKTLMAGMKQPAFRAKQIHQWLYEKGASSFDDMTNLPAPLRGALAAVCTLEGLAVAVELQSKDGTVKRAYRCGDGQVIESVLMPYKDGRRTACISSQAGCAMGCVFCATGQMGLSRQLTAAEIVEQVYRYDRELRSKGERLSNIVFMGMGEPLNNYKNVMKAVRFINQDIGIGARHITISTVGLVPRIHKLAEEDVQIKLAISLHAANDEDRSALLPVNRRYNLNQLMDACENYIKITNRRITFEYALIAGENDTPQVAHELGRLLRRVKGFAHVNVIPLNPTAGFDGGPSQANAVNAFLEILNDKYKIPATPRVRRGIDIDAGCGQLKSEVLGKGF